MTQTPNHIWLMEPAALEAYQAERAAVAPKAAGFSGVVSRSTVPAVEDGVAVIEVNGTLTPHATPWTLLLGETPMDNLRRQIQWAAAQEEIEGIILSISSPGGTVDGTAETAAVVAEASRFKSVVAHIDGVGASAAYYIASQADRVFANASAMVGSIGVVVSLLDESKAYKADGLRRVVVSSGKHKGSLISGKPISDADLNPVRDLVADHHSAFLEAVSRGRQLSGAALEAVGDGAIYSARQAVSLRLIDEVATLQDTLEHLKLGGNPMVVKSNTPATLAELKQACPGADSDFILAQAEAGATVEDAKSAFITHQADQLSKRSVTLPRAYHGERVETRNEHGGGAGGGEFQDLVTQQMESGMSRQEAIRFVATTFPEAHREYLLAANGPRRAAFVEARF